MNNRKQPEKKTQNKIQSIRSTPIRQFQPHNLMTVHQSDCIYYGQINRSYQKEGFGIIQTLDFQMYFGFFKNNKAEGLGLIIYPTGQIIYGHFSRDQISGLVLIDSRQTLRIGTHEGIENIGIAFEYTYQTRIWKIVRYNRGVPVAQIKQEQCDIREGIPSIIAAEHSFYMLLKNYRENNLFMLEENFKDPTLNYSKTKLEKKEEEKEEPRKYQNLNDLLVNQNSKGEIFVGLRDEGGAYGLGCLIDKQRKVMLEAGYYMGGRLEGYGRQQVNGSKLVGPFLSGMRNGLFIEYSSSKIEIYRFAQDSKVGESDQTYEQISKFGGILEKRQKAYNYQQKDFLSARNTLKVLQFFSIFQSPEIRHYKRSKKNDEDVGPQIMELPEGEMARIKSVKGGKLMQNQRVSHTYLKEVKELGSERTSLEIIKQKLKNLQLITEEEQVRMHSKEGRHVTFEDEDDIAQEQNPFDSVTIGKNYLNQSPNRRHK